MKCRIENKKGRLIYNRTPTFRAKAFGVKDEFRNENIKFRLKLMNYTNLDKKLFLIDFFK